MNNNDAECEAIKEMAGKIAGGNLALKIHAGPVNTRNMRGDRWGRCFIRVRTVCVYHKPLKKRKKEKKKKKRKNREKETGIITVSIFIRRLSEIRPRGDECSDSFTTLRTPLNYRGYFSEIVGKRCYILTCFYGYKDRVFCINLINYFYTYV